MKEDLARAVGLIRESGKTIALTGAGVSTESGIPDFRSKGGLWSRFDPNEYGTLGAFRRDPRKVWKMLAELVNIVDARPNSGHIAMASMQQAGLLDAIVTQNIDGLHQKAGSHSVVEFHGSMATFSCIFCNSSLPLDEIRAMPMPPRCSCGEILKPDIVFFDEMIPAQSLVMTEKLVDSAEVLIVIGTSCQVTPASSIPHIVKQRGGRIIEINLEPALGSVADIALVGKFTRTMTMLVAGLNM